MISKTAIRLTTMAAALGIAVLAPATASAASVKDETIRAYMHDGHATFKGHGEHLYACDEAFDGDTIVAKLWVNGELRAKVEDENGAAAGCGHFDDAIKDGTKVAVQVCHKEDGSCSGRVYGTA